MADNRSISGTVEVKNDSADRVAFDLMEKIAYHEESKDTGNRDYWLTLFWQCRKATNYLKLESILERK